MSLLSFTGTNQPLDASADTLPEISFPTHLDDSVTGSAMDMFQWDETNTFANPMDMSTQAQGSDYLQSEIIPGPSISSILGLSVTPPSPDQPPPLQSDQVSNASSGFLQQDNTRLRNSNDQLRDEVEELRRQHGET